MNRRKLWRVMRKEMRGVLRVSPLVLASLVLVALLWRTDSSAVSDLLQSSPVETPPPSLTPTTQPAVTATNTPEPTVIESPVATTTAGTATGAPTEPVVPSETPTIAPPTETLEPTDVPLPTEPPATDTPAPSATAEPEEPLDESQRYPDDESNLRFEWGMLFDSMALFLSYVWLCCGILLFIAVPLFFFVLWRTSASRQEEAGQDEPGQEETGQEEPQREETGQDKA